VSNLNLELERRDQLFYVRLSGDLDMAEAQSLEAELRRIEEDEGPPLLVLDLSELDFIDSFGIRSLIETQRRAQADGRRLALVPARDTIQEIFRVTLLDRRFEWIEAPGKEEPPAAAGPA
jgi:anti-sigma B factor antagonist